MELSPGDLQEILRVFVDSDLRDLHIEVGDVKLRVSKDGGSLPPEPAVTPRPPPVAAPRQAAEAAVEQPDEPVRATAPAPPAVPAEADVDRSGLVEIVSPAVGVFYRRPAPDQPSYVEIGNAVEPSTPVCTIEVMKMFTEVLAGCHGTIVEICAENEQLVEHGQVLMYVRPPGGAV